jgi:hypothetical protein
MYKMTKLISKQTISREKKAKIHDYEIKFYIFDWLDILDL